MNQIKTIKKYERRLRESALTSFSFDFSSASSRTVKFYTWFFILYSCWQRGKLTPCRTARMPLRCDSQQDAVFFLLWGLLLKAHQRKDPSLWSSYLSHNLIRSPTIHHWSSFPADRSILESSSNSGVSCFAIYRYACHLNRRRRIDLRVFSILDLLPLLRWGKYR